MGFIGDLMDTLVGGDWNMTCIFPYIGNNHPNWVSYFSEGLKPPTSDVLNVEPNNDCLDFLGYQTSHCHFCFADVLNVEEQNDATFGPLIIFFNQPVGGMDEDWWFGTLGFFQILGIIIPTVVHIQRGWNQQPDCALPFWGGGTQANRIPYAPCMEYLPTCLL